MKNIFNILDERYRFNRAASLFVDVPLENQLLWEDIIQISTERNPDLCVDIGWYGSEVETGYFRIVIINDKDWEEPIYSRTTRSIEQLEIYLRESLIYLNE